MKCAMAGAVALCLLGGAIDFAAAQDAGSRAWELEFHGGGLFSHLSGDGTARLPDPGVAFPTFFPGGTSRRVSSWYFGDGALLMNQAIVIFPWTVPLTPLDSVLNPSAVRRESGGSVGFKLSRRVTDRLRAEWSVDYGLAQLALQRGALAAIESTRASFATSLQKIFPVPFVGSTASSIARIDERQGRNVVTTGALHVNLRRQGVAIPFVVVGGGVISNTGGTPGMALEGVYSFRLPGGFAVPVITEGDRVSVRYTVADHTAAGLVGGGIRYSLSPRWVLRLEARGLFSKNTLKVTLDAAPQSTPTGMSSALTVGTSPAIQFSNTTLPTSLSGPALRDFVTFDGSGLNRQINLTVGLGWRF